jgi:transglutaminase-like putative cysteine protease
MAILLAGISSNAAAEWVPVSNDSGDTIFADPATIRRAGNMVTIKELTDRKNPSTGANGKLYLSSLSVFEYDCDKSRFRLLSFRTTSKNMGQGRILTDIKYTDNWVEIKPDSVAARLKAYACGAGTVRAVRAYEPQISVERDVRTFVVNADGTYSKTVENAIRVKTSQGAEDHGSRQISYTPSQEVIHSIKAWTTQADGTSVPVLPSAIREREEDNSGGASEFTDTKYRVMIFPQVKVGSLLGYKLQSNVHTSPYPGEFGSANIFSPTVPYDHWEAHFVIPESRMLHIDQRGVSGGLEKTVGGLSFYSFRYSRSTVSPPEEGSASAIHYADYLFVSTMPDMASLGKLANTFFQSKVEVNDEIRHLAAKLTEGKDDERAKVKALYLWVAQNIRYVSISLLDGRLVPHKASEILANRYGDCKDHTVLLESLLAAVGIVSSPALLNAGASYEFSKIGIHYPMNHVITYVPSLDLYLDSTDRFAPFGTLPYADMDKPALLTALGKLGRTPRMKAEEHATRVDVFMEIAEDGSISGNSMARMIGIAENNSRTARFEKKSEPEEEVVKRLLNRFSETGSGSLNYTDPEDLDRPYWVRAHFSLDPVLNVPGRGALAVPVGLAPGEIASAANDKPLAAPKLPYYCRSKLVEERYMLQFPPSIVIEGVPKGMTYSKGGIEYQSKFRRSGQKVHVERRLRIQREAPLCSAVDHTNWVTFHKVLKRDLRSQIFYN